VVQGQATALLLTAVGTAFVPGGLDGLAEPPAGVCRREVDKVEDELFPSLCHRRKPQLVQRYAGLTTADAWCCGPPAMAYSAARNVLSLMAILTIGRRRSRARQLPTVRPVLPSRDWYPIRQAAAMLGTSESTLRRRTSKAHWRDGLHYRWVTRQSRRTLEVNVAQVIKLMNAIGWA
jgi:hypothetical protein